VDWDLRSLPDILYQLHRSIEDTAVHTWEMPPQMVDIDGELMWDPVFEFEEPPFPILDWPTLPERIGTAEDWCQIKAWKRTDKRIGYRDILTRMPPANRPTENRINMEILRERPSFNITTRDPHCASTKHQGQRQERLKRLEPANGKHSPCSICTITRRVV